MAIPDRVATWSRKSYRRVSPSNWSSMTDRSGGSPSRSFCQTPCRVIRMTAGVFEYDRIRACGGGREKRVTLLETNLQGLQKRQGKVRDVYDLGDRLLLIATDRISAFDWVLSTGIPDKGRVLTGLSQFWFENVVPPYSHHLHSTDLNAAGLDLTARVREDL